MLSAEENALLTRTGPGTPMGDPMRQYWLPALMSSELPAPDCLPLRVRLLGENLVAFRTTSGKVGLLAHACPHRGASLFYGRNEAEGIRCVYHGWKFDVAGRCVDMPSEPAESATVSSSRIWGRGRSLHHCRTSSPTCYRMDRPKYGRPCGSATGCRPWRAI